MYGICQRTQHGACHTAEQVDAADQPSMSTAAQPSINTSMTITVLAAHLHQVQGEELGTSRFLM
jgi:hypothetical protein